MKDGAKKKIGVERWECTACGVDVPCRVEIRFTPTDYPHVEAQDRFLRRRRICLCDDDPSLFPEWRKLPPEDPE